MSVIRFYTDEDVAPALATALRQRGYDAISVHELGSQGLTDEEQLALASRERRALVTHNTRHFVPLHREWLAAGRYHHGVIVTTREPVGVLLTRMLNLLGSVTAEDIENGLVWLNSYR